MLGRARTLALIGLDAVPVTVEAHVGPGLPGLHVIGLSGGASAQAADRVRTALGAIGVTMPTRKALVSLAPADVPKVGARFDLAMAVAVLAALGLIPEQALRSCWLVGELALDGAIREATGILPSAGALLRAAGGSVRAPRLLVPEANAAEATLVGAVEVVPVADLGEALAVLRAERPARTPAAAGEQPGGGGLPDLADVRGQPEARRALEIAAAGGHHLLLLGPPGCGKSMLARRLPSLLPALARPHALEVAGIRSVAGLLSCAGAPGGWTPSVAPEETPGAPRRPPLLDRAPPFRAPHHSLSAAALLGGGSGIARPGELSLAHRGVLFLDELFEWPRRLLDALRAPLEEGVVRVARTRATVTYPARVQLVAAANPCPCGGAGECACADEAVASYRARLSGPLADRIDLAPAVRALEAADLLATEAGEGNGPVAARVAGARELAAARWATLGTGGSALNAQAVPAALRRCARPDALAALARQVESGLLTGRGYDRTLRVARTCADLEGCELVERRHVLEAQGHRTQLAPARPPTLR